MTPLHAIHQSPPAIVESVVGNKFVGQSIDVKPGEVRETIPPVEEPLNGNLSGNVAHCAPEWLTKDQFEIRCTDSNGELLIISGPYWGTSSTKHKRK